MIEHPFRVRESIVTPDRYYVIVEDNGRETSYTKRSYELRDALEIYCEAVDVWTRHVTEHMWSQE